MEHRFGGEWTESKLERLARYLPAYTTALKNQPFSLVYIDAFAGTGSRSTEDPLEFADGSARIALATQPPFDRYILVEKSAAKCKELERLKVEFREIADRVSVICADGNDYLQSLAREDWSNRRAVLFLDPYGLQVSFKTMEVVAATHAIDVWLLFPAGGTGVNRLLTKDGKMSPAWESKLDTVFGTTEWRMQFYREDPQGDFFAEPGLDKIATWRSITKFYTDRLRTIGFAVHPSSLALENSKHSVLYQLCFAVSNPSHNARALAFRIAENLLRG